MSGPKGNIRDNIKVNIIRALLVGIAAQLAEVDYFLEL